MKLIIPPKVSNTAPKPTKAQIVEALLERARKAHVEAEAVKDAKREKLEVEGVALVLEAFKQVKPTTKSVTLVHPWNWDRPATVKVEIKTPAIRSIQKKIADLSSSRFDEDATKRKIKNSLTAANPLLGNDEVAKSLDAMLAAIFNTTPVIEA